MNSWPFLHPLAMVSSNPQVGIDVWSSYGDFYLNFYVVWDRCIQQNSVFLSFSIWFILYKTSEIIMACKSEVNLSCIYFHNILLLLYCHYWGDVNAALQLWECFTRLEMFFFPWEWLETWELQLRSYLKVQSTSN